jgi:hypothetical protein
LFADIYERLHRRLDVRRYIAHEYGTFLFADIALNRRQRNPNDCLPVRDWPSGGEAVWFERVVA